MRSERETLFDEVAKDLARKAGLNVERPGAGWQLWRKDVDAVVFFLEKRGVRLLPVENTPGVVAQLSGVAAGSLALSIYDGLLAVSPYAPDPHPHYAGGCDALGPDGTCAECDKLKSSDDPLQDKQT